jgi:hypothetical protein
LDGLSLFDDEGGFLDALALPEVAVLEELPDVVALFQMMARS